MDRRQFLRVAGISSLAGLAGACAAQSSDPLPAAAPTPDAGAPTSDAATPPRPAPATPTATATPEATTSPAAATPSDEPPTDGTAEPPAEPVASAEPSPSASEPEPEPAPTPEPTPEPSEGDGGGVLVVDRICRDAWGARPAGDGMREHTITRLTVHHSAVVLGSNDRAPTRLRGHQRYHMDSAGWADIAYHLGVDRNGNVYDLRELRFAGDTFTEYDPAGHYLVLCEGDFNKEVPSDRQLEGLARTLALGARQFGVSTDTISGHRDHAGTTCPGDALYGALPDVRARAADLVRQGTVEWRPLCGEEGRERVAAIEAGREG